MKASGVGAALTSLESFSKFDENHQLLKAHSYHTVLLIARIYTADSIKYKAQADYWLYYLAKLAF